MSFTITPMMRLVRCTSAWASALGAYPRSAAAASTRARVCSETGWVEPLRTRDAVATDVPARRLMSASDAMGASLPCRPPLCHA